MQEEDREKMLVYLGGGGNDGDLKGVQRLRAPIKIFLSFKDLGRVLLAVDDEFPAVIQKITKARTVWQRTSKILCREGARPGVAFFI